MDFGEFVEGIEKLIVRILLWVVIIPKTLFQILTQPYWIVGYIDKELGEGIHDREDQFDDFMSPIMLFLICSLVLFFILGSMPSVDSILTLRGSNGIAQANNGQNGFEYLFENMQGVNGFLSALAFLSLPLIFSLAIEYFSRQKIIRAKLVRTLNIQCYFFSPLTLSIFATLIIISLLSDSIDGFWVIIFATLIVVGIIIWFLIIQVQFIKAEIGGPILKSAFIFIGCAGFSLVIVALVFTLLNQTSHIDWWGIGETESMQFELPADGKYTIEISGYAGNQYGDYQLMLKQDVFSELASVFKDVGNKPSGSLAYNEIISTDFTGNDRVQWDFEGQEGDLVNIFAYPSENFDVMFQVVDEQQNVIAFADDYSEGGYEEIQELVLPESGHYSILIEGYEDSTGQFELELLDASLLAVGSNGDFVGSTSSISTLKDTGGSVSGSLAYNEYITADYTGNDHVQWDFEGEEGDVVDITAYPHNNFDLILHIVDDQEKVIANIDTFGDGGSEEFLGFVIPETGQYSVLIEGYQNSTGLFDLELAQSNLFEIADNSEGGTNIGKIGYGQFVNSSFVEGESVRWEFEGKQDDLVTLSIIPDSNYDPFFDILDKEGSSIFSRNDDIMSVVLAAIYVVLVGFAVLLGLRSIWKNARSNRPVEAGEIGTAVPELAEEN